MTQQCTLGKILIASAGLTLSLLSSCTLVDRLGRITTVPASQGSVGSCHAFVITSIYEEKLEQEGIETDLSEKDLFLRAYFRGLNERQEILRQLTMSVDRQLPTTFREGATLDRVAAIVRKHGQRHVYGCGKYTLLKNYYPIVISYKGYS